jgi:mRNA-degrading endonuclease RelE of RelBE toxin-antitoxin system
MSYSVKTITVFEKQAKRLFKKYHSLKQELLDLIQLLKEHPEQGTVIGKNCFKIRISIASKGKGKSGGARIVTHFVFTDATVYLLYVTRQKRKLSLIKN